MTKRVIFLLIFLSSFFNGFAQFSVTNSAPYNSSNHLISNVFAGGNVSISNVNTIGAAPQIGFFSGGMASIGMDSGIVLSTGPIRDLCPATCTGASTTPALPGN